MSLVIDSSITLAWLFEDERTPVAEDLLRRVAETGAIAPSLWRLEVANGLQMAVRRNRIDVAARDASLADLRLLNITVDEQTDHHAWSTTLQLADRWQLTLYDAAYLELAQRTSLPLATLDKQLHAAGQSTGISTLGL